MSFAASLERAERYSWRRRTSSLGRRAAAVLALVTADLACFLISDRILHAFTGLPAVTLLRGGKLGVFGTLDLMLAIAAIFVLTRYVFGDYSRRALFWDGALNTTKALVIWGSVYAFAIAISSPQDILAVVIVWIGLMFLVPCARQLARWGLARVGLWYQPTAILGTSAAAQEVCSVLGRELSLGLEVRWVLPEGPEVRIPLGMGNLKIISAKPEAVADSLVAIGCSQAILVPDERLQQAPGDLIDQLIGAQISVAIVPSLRKLPLFGLSTSYFFGKDLLLLQVRNNLGRLPQRLFKRSLDLFLGTIAVVLLSPILVVIAILIKLEDGGPVLFKQNRVGYGGGDFLCWKFRTMALDAEDQLARWPTENSELYARYRDSNFKLADDPRVTKIGRLLRRSSADEFPQIFNVLGGDMSLVGPRPLLRRELPDYGAPISLYERVRPGITGLWQISGRSNTTFSERVSYDEWYIKNWTVWYDLVIMLQTAWMLLRGGGGAY